ncbi:MAG TPA: SDR family NAD(P)-dependent oxidoreductase [Microbacteriaceae bacterium]|nr:SDR family NAD(P)-dependent oxidoreductase [Microbacteriaceae bacterium]
MKIDNISAVVTGAASGLGRAVAGALAAGGAQVIGIDLQNSIDKAETAEGIKFIAADVTSEEQVQKALEQLSEAPLRVAVNCAGIAPAQRILSSKGAHDLELFRKTIDINLVGSFNVLRLVAEKMAGNDPLENDQRGVIINVASVAAYEGQIGQAAYASSKGGIVGLTITAARDLARNGIRVNTIAPGIIDTPLLAALGPEVNASLAASVPFPQRLGTPADFARLALMIVEHDYLNGETIRMDGALRMPPK